jgi:hypothetical protein
VSNGLHREMVDVELPYWRMVRILNAGLIKDLKCFLELQYSAYPDQMEAMIVYLSVSKIDSEDYYLASAFDLNLLDE